MHYSSWNTKVGKHCVTGPARHSMDRDAVVASIEQAPTWDSYTITDPTMLRLGSDDVILLYTGTGRRGADPELVPLMSSVYSRIDEAWRLVHYQRALTESVYVPQFTVTRAAPCPRTRE